MPSVFKGSISFGLVNVPIKLFAATQKQAIAFRTLHKKCGTPINQKRWCAECQSEVEYSDTIKGYEVAKGEFVEISNEDIKKIDLKTTKYIQILDFISLDEIDPIYFDKPYFIAPDASGEKAYVLLHKAMSRTNTAAIARLAMREKEQLCVVRVYGESLMLSTMLFSTEIRTAETDVGRLEKKADISDAELDMACKIVDNLTGMFEPEKYHDRYYDELMKIIEAKQSGEAPNLRKESNKESGRAMDLFEKLKASMEATKATANKAGNASKEKNVSKSVRAKKENKPSTKEFAPKPPEKSGRSHLSV